MSTAGVAPAAVELLGLGHVYPDGTRALDGVDLIVPVGQRLAIVGQNGSGKSTLVRHLDGLLRPTEGRVIVGGIDAATLKVAELSARVGLVFQDPDKQIFAGSVQAEVGFGPRNLGRRGAELEAAVSDAIAAVGLTDLAATNPYDLGYSRRKLLALASILAMGTPIVVFDEPTTGQDARGIGRIQELVSHLATGGRTVITISHDMRFVAESFERVVVMQAGRISLDGTPAEVYAEANWRTLSETNLEPPLPTRVGVRLGLGSTPTDRLLVEALARRG